MERSTAVRNRRAAWFATQEEAGHSERLITPYELNLLYMVDLLTEFPVQLLHPYFSNKRGCRLCHLLSGAVLNHEFFWILVGKLRGKPLGIVVSAPASEYTTGWN